MGNPKLSLYLTIIIATYLTRLSHTPPNPNPVNVSGARPRDRLHLFVGVRYLVIRRLFLLSFCTFHGLIVLLYPSSPTSKIPNTLTAICPHYENLNTDLFTWSRRSSVSLGIIILFTTIRLMAFRSLGTSFTFALVPPPSLKTTGLYAYLQHPSYTANLLLMAANIHFFFQPDGIMGCTLPESIARSAFWSVLGWVLVGGALLATFVRVGDEERMLKEAFGKEWEIWNRKTKRFVPWIF